MTRIESDHPRWHDIATGIVIGAVGVAIPFVAVALMGASGLWMGSW